MSDQKTLVEQIVAGDRAAFRTLIVDHQKLVWHIVLRMVPRESEREDICQEVFLKVYQNLSSFRFDSKLSTWIGRITFNTCMNYLDKKKLPFMDDLNEDNSRFEPEARSDQRPDNVFADQETSTILKEQIDTLPPVYKTIVTLYHLDELSYAEISNVMKLPEGTVKSYLFRARRQLKDSLLAKYQREEL